MRNCVNIFGLDLGQSNDYSALVLVEQPIYIYQDEADRLGLGGDSCWRDPSTLSPSTLRALSGKAPPTPPALNVRGIQRWPLGTSYPSIVADVRQWVLGQLHAEHTALVIDKTGVGRPIFDLFIAAGLKPIGVSITGGDQVKHDGDSVSVPKRDLIGAVQSVLGARRLKFASALPLLAALQAELQAFRVKVNLQTGHDSYAAWREKDHDDLVLALAIAVWHALDQEAHPPWSHEQLRVFATGINS